jgi:SPP1 gp7 family putative phage head morphogenesis protein
MPWAVTADHERFDEALAWFESRVPYTRDQFDALDDMARRNAFYISGGLELEAVQTVLDEIKRNVEKGEPFEAFQKSVREKLAGKLGPDGFHLETVYRNAVQASYNTGRWYQLTDPEMTLLRPYLMFDAVLDDRTTSVCRACDGVVKAHDDPWWLTHAPALHHRCRSTLRSLRPSEARRRGITASDPVVEVPDGWGAAPPAKASGEELKPKAERFDPEAWTEYQKRHAVAMDELQVAQAAVTDEREKRKLRDPATFKQQYETTLEDAGPAVAWGRAMEERGLQMTVRAPTDARAKLVTAGVHASEDSLAALDSTLERMGATTPKKLHAAYDGRTMAEAIDAALEAGEVDAAAHIRGISALAGHATSIKRTPLASIAFDDVIPLPGALLKEREMKAAAKEMARFYAAIATRASCSRPASSCTRTLAPAPSTTSWRAASTRGGAR